MSHTNKMYLACYVNVMYTYDNSLYLPTPLIDIYIFKFIKVKNKKTSSESDKCNDNEPSTSFDRYKLKELKAQETEMIKESDRLTTLITTLETNIENYEKEYACFINSLLCISLHQFSS